MPKSRARLEESDRRVKRILDSGQKAVALLQERLPLPTDVERDLRDAIETHLAVLQPAVLAKQHISMLDTLGINIWNAATNLLRGTPAIERGPPPPAESPKTLAVLRVFAFLVIMLVRRPTAAPPDNAELRIRPLKLGLKATQLALDCNELELADKVVVQCAEIVPPPPSDQPTIRLAEPTLADDQQLVLRRLTCEFLMLRVAVALKAGNPDLARHLYGKVDFEELRVSQELAERAARLLFVATQRYVSNKQTDLALEWGERALAIVNHGEKDTPHDLPELCLAISSTLVDSLVALQAPGSHARAAELVDQLKTVHGLSNRVAVSLLHFNVLSAANPPDLQDLQGCLSRMMKLAALTEKTFLSFMRAIHKTRRVDIDCALIGLGDLIDRVLTDLTLDCKDSTGDNSSRERLEKALITYVLFATDRPGSDQHAVTDNLQWLFDKTAQHYSAISSKAGHAAQTLLWKACSTSGPAFTQAWCSLMQHRIFDHTGQVNKVRIARKTIVAALSVQDVDTARRLFLEMSPASQNDNISRYLAFRIAVLSNDPDLALESLQSIAKHSDNDCACLYACVLEAQQSQQNSLAVLAMQTLLDRRPPGVHVPTLLRCTAKLLVSELDSEQRDLAQVVTQVADIFDTASSHIALLHQGTTEESRNEIQWWSKTAFNLGLRLCTDINLQDLIRILQSCLKFIDCWPKDTTSVENHDITKRRATCHFLSATTWIVLARSNVEGSEASATAYTNVRTSVALYTTTISHLDPSYATDRIHHLRTFELLKFDLEAILILQQWPDLDAALQTLLTSTITDNWSSLLDLTLILHDRVSPLNIDPKFTARIPDVLQKCINETWKRDKDIVQMSRWLRLTFLIHMNDGAEGDGGGFALKIVQQASFVAKKFHGGGRAGDAYPEPELQWLAAMSFNHAVDLLVDGEEARADEWIEAALELARWAQDNGALHANLTHKRNAAAERRRHGIV